MKLKDILDSFVENGAGEIIINNIDRDGTLLGFDQELIKETNFINRLKVVSLVRLERT